MKIFNRCEILNYININTANICEFFFVLEKSGFQPPYNIENGMVC